MKRNNLRRVNLNEDLDEKRKLAAREGALECREGLEVFIKICKDKNLSAETIIGYVKTLKPVIDYFEDNEVYYLNDVIEDICNEKIQKIKDDVSVQYANRTLKHLKLFFNQLYIKRKIDFPSPVARTEFMKCQVKEELSLTDQDVKKILSCCDRDTFTGYRNYIMFLLILSCGLRRKEIINLKLSNIVLDENLIYLDVVKGNKERIVPVDNKTVRMLKKYIYEREGRFNINNDFFFNGVDGKPLSEEGAKTILSRHQKLMKRQNICLAPRRKFTWHSLRKKFATDFIYTGGDIYELKIILGHKDIITTQKYVKLNGADLARKIKDGKLGTYRNKFI